MFNSDKGRVWSVDTVDNFLISGGEDGIFIWTISSGKKIKSFKPVKSAIWKLATYESTVLAGAENGQEKSEKT